VGDIFQTPNLQFSTYDSADFATISTSSQVDIHSPSISHVPDMIAVGGRGLAIINGSEVLLTDFGLNGSSGMLISDDVVSAVAQVPSMQPMSMVTATTGGINFYHHVNFLFSHQPVLAAKFVCHGSEVGVTNLSPVLVGTEWMVLASSDAHDDCGASLYDMEGHLRQILHVEGRVVSHTQVMSQKKVLHIAVNVQQSCTIQSFTMDNGVFVSADTRFVQGGVQCSGQIRFYNDGVLLAVSAESLGNSRLMHIPTNLSPIVTVWPHKVAATAIVGDAILVSSMDEVIVFRKSSVPVRRLKLSSPGVTIAVLNNHVVVDTEDHTLAYFRKTDIFPDLKDFSQYELTDGRAMCVKECGPDDQGGHGAGAGFGAVFFEECSSDGDVHQRWQDQGTEMHAVSTGMCITLIQADNRDYLTFLPDFMSPGCLTFFVASGGYWYTTSFEFEQGVYGCVVEGADDSFNFYLQECGNSLADCDNTGCATGWHRAVQSISV